MPTPVSSLFGLLPWMQREKEATDNANVTNRAAFLPLAEYDDGKVHPAVPGVIKSLGEKQPGVDAMVNQDAEATGRETALTGLGMLGAGTLFGGAPKGAFAANSMRELDDVPWDLPDVAQAGAAEPFFGSPPRGANAPERPVSETGVRFPQTLDEYIDILKKRQAERGGGLVNFDDLRSMDNVAPAMGDAASLIEAPKRGSRSADRFKHGATKQRLDTLRNQGAMFDDNGKPVNPWYRSAPMINVLRQFTDDPYGTMAGWQKNEAVTSPKTSVPRNVPEGLNAWWYAQKGELPPWQDLLFQPGNKQAAIARQWDNPYPGVDASPEALTAYYSNFVKGPKRKVAHFGAALGGGGSVPVDFKPGAAGIVVNDAIMAKPNVLNLRDKEGYPSESYGTPGYYEASDAVTQSGVRAEDALGAIMAPSDTQAAIWQARQLAEHKKDDYMMPNNWFYDDTFRIAADHYGISKEKMLEEFLSGQRGLPMNLYSEAGPFSPMGAFSDEEEVQ